MPHTGSGGTEGGMSRDEASVDAANDNERRAENGQDVVMTLDDVVVSMIFSVIPI